MNSSDNFSKNKHTVLTFRIIYTCLMILLFLSGCEPYNYTPVTTHEVTETLGLEEVWKRDNVFIGYSGNPIMVASEGIIAFLGGLDINDQSTLTTLSAESGELLWQKGYGSPNEIFASSDALFVGQSGLAGVTKLDLTTGAIVWHTSLEARGLRNLTVLGDEIHVDTAAMTDKFFVLNATTGEIVRQVDTDTYLSFWNIEVDNQIFRVSVFTEDANLILEDGKIYCLEPTIGKVKWQTEYIAASNLVVAEDLVFFLTKDGQLQALDLQTGELRYFVRFDTDRFILSGEAHIGGYNVAYDPQTKLIFAQLGDSAQLFAFQILK